MAPMQRSWPRSWGNASCLVLLRGAWPAVPRLRQGCILAFVLDTRVPGGPEMLRYCWVGALSFGLVHVPVRLYSAVEPREVQFHLLHDEDGGRIQQKRVCAADGQEVSYEHVVKGYELRRGQYVEVTRGELEAFDPKSSRTIEL